MIVVYAGENYWMLGETGREKTTEVPLVVLTEVEGAVAVRKRGSARTSCRQNMRPTAT